MNNSLRQMVYTSLFTALIIVGGYISIPLPFNPVPLVLSDFFVLLAGLTLGATWGGAAVALYVFLGFLGLPVFAGGKAGLAVLFGPTGGFVFGYLAETIIAGWVTNQGKPSRLKDGLAIGLGLVMLFSFGVTGIAVTLHLGLGKALAVGLLPFLPGSAIKATVIWLVVRPLRQLVQNPD
jgi:biotin transport system substrate-specific component